MNTAYQGHAGRGGLQKHSIGATYPFMVVGTMQRSPDDIDSVTDKTRYYVLDTATGDRYFWSPGCSGLGITWPDIRSAEMVAGHLKAGDVGPCLQRIPA